MSALQQYIDLYKAHRSLIEEHSCAPLNALREKAYAALFGMRLPEKGAEHYVVSDLEKILAPDYGINLAKVNIDINPAASFHCGVPHLSSSLFFLANDTYASAENSCEGLPEGAFVGSLKAFARAYPDVLSRYYGAAANMENPVVALNTLLSEDGFVVYLKRGVKVEKPLQLVNVFDNGTPLMGIRRLLVIIEPEAEGRLLMCDHTQNPDVDFLSLQTVEIFVEDRAKFDLYDLEESSERTSRLSALYLRQGEGSEVMVDGMTLFNGFTRNEYHCSHAGRHGFLRLYGMGIGDRRRRVETYSRVCHEVPECHTDELFKYVVDDEAVASFEGMVYVAPHAEKTEAYQSNRNIVGSDMARMFSRPQLEIYNDDVKCSHGSAIGQLDQKQVFYMRTRGLSEATAKLLLKQAFMADVIEGVQFKPLRERLHLMVERRFSGEANSGCSACSAGDCPASN